MSFLVVWLHNRDSDSVLSWHYLVLVSGLRHSIDYLSAYRNHLGLVHGWLVHVGILIMLVEVLVVNCMYSC